MIFLIFFHFLLIITRRLIEVTGILLTILFLISTLAMISVPTLGHSAVAFLLVLLIMDSSVIISMYPWLFVKYVPSVIINLLPVQKSLSLWLNLTVIFNVFELPILFNKFRLMPKMLWSLPIVRYRKFLKHWIWFSSSGLSMVLM